MNVDRFLRGILLPIAACFVWLGSGASWTVAQDAIEAGERALRETRQPWYDSSTDGLKPLTVDTMEQTERGDWRGLERPDWNWDWNWGSPNLSWIGELFKVLAWIVLISLLALLIYTLVQAFLNMESNRPAAGAGMRGEAVSDAQRIENLPIPLLQKKGDFLEIAKQHYESGNFPEAIIYLFSHRLLQLDRAGVIRLSKGKTNRQYLLEVKGPRELRQILGQTIVIFEDVFFGKHPLGRVRFEGCWQQNSRFQAIVQEVMT